MAEEAKYLRWEKECRRKISFHSFATERTYSFGLASSCFINCKSKCQKLAGQMFKVLDRINKHGCLWFENKLAATLARLGG